MTGDDEVYGALTDSPPSAAAELVVIVSLSSLVNMPIKEIKQCLYHERRLLISDLHSKYFKKSIYFLLTRRIATDVIKARPQKWLGR